MRVVVMCGLSPQRLLLFLHSPKNSPPRRVCVRDSPVHGELGHQRDVVLRGRVLVLQEVEVHSVHGDPLPPEVVALVVFVEVLQRRLQLEEKKPRTE